MKFLPCPFCGSADIRLLLQEYGFSADCQDCGAMKRVCTRHTKQVFASWNQRPNIVSNPELL